ncbi:hypothetical protein [Sphingobacterium athyrii]|uniref:Uncharacterized protein n=1 Tax=Sphingobacterium athyrii TaxID=2152717 RepID=A0A363NP28_9SPHI|nr:hypothetical protein [Sphingobacterium athyrii]PUV22528.1 hypothetical protein DCO56_20170 [Sphingobacterium athyrii]
MENKYRETLSALDLVSIGFEAFNLLVQIKGMYSHLRVGYIYYAALDCLSDWQGNPVVDNFTFIPLMTDAVPIYGGTSYRICSIDINTVHAHLEAFADHTVLFGAMHDPILIKLLDFYAFSQKRLILRRPLKLEGSNAKPYIDKYLRFSKTWDHVTVLDSHKVIRYLNRLDSLLRLPEVGEEIEQLWLKLILEQLDLPVSIDFANPRLPQHSCLFINL